MTTVLEVTDLFAKLASHLKTLNQDHREEEEEALELSLSKLNQSLNLNNEDSRVRVLDTALSRMCFKAPQVSSTQSLGFCTKMLCVSFLYV